MSKPKPNLSYIAEHLRKMAVPIDSLQLDPDNARRHDEANRASIRASLVERGQVLPITVRLFNRRVMTGNGTLEEARALGWTHIAAILLDYDEAQAAAWAIAHNRSAELGQWDFEQLAATMVEFDSVDWGAVGWEASELEAIIEQARVEAGHRAKARMRAGRARPQADQRIDGGGERAAMGSRGAQHRRMPIRRGRRRLAGSIRRRVVDAVPGEGQQDLRRTWVP